jgi:RHS repeat-associated protein
VLDGAAQLTEVSLDENGTLAWQHTNVYAAGTLMASYDPNGLHFLLNDWLGTRRAQTDYAGVLEQTCASLPFGNQLNCTGSISAPTEHHFTGKERDAESGLDYFGARYYGSNMGRFMSPDWSAKQEPVPYSKLDNPQSLNLYAYEFNNPLGGVDADGHGCGGPGEAACPTGQQIGQDPTLPNAVAPPPPIVEQRLNSVADKVEGALFPKTWGDMASLALSLPTDGLASMAGALPRVMELAGAMEKTADYATIAVTETKEGVSIVSSSEARGLRPAVQAALKPGEVA